MLYTYRNTVTGIEFQSNCIITGSNLIRLEPSAPIVEEKVEPKAETKAPKKPAKKGTKK